MGRVGPVGINRSISSQCTSSRCHLLILDCTFRQVPSPLVLVIPPKQSHFSDVKKFGFIPPHPASPLSVVLRGLLPTRLPLGVGAASVAPWHWSLTGLCTLCLLPGHVSPWSAGGTCPSMGFICASRVRLFQLLLWEPAAFSVPALVGRPMDRLSRPQVLSPAASALLGPAPGPGLSSYPVALWTLCCL